MLLVLAYDKKYNTLWQIVDKDMTVIKQYRKREEALEAFAKMQADNEQG